MYSKNLGLIQGESQEALLSGAISAVQVLLEEINVGPIEVIKTDQYRIILTKFDNFVIFLIGDFQNEDLVKPFLQRISNVFKQYKSMMNQTIIHSSEIAQNIDRSLMNLFRQLEFQSFQIGVLVQEDKFGFKLISGTDDMELDTRIVGYLSFLPTSVSQRTQLFTIPVSKTKIITCLIYKPQASSRVFALYSIFPNESLLSMLYNYPLLFDFGKQLIEANTDLLSNYKKYAFELHHIFFDASQVLKEKILLHPFPLIQKQEYNDALAVYYPLLHQILPLLFLGKKIAVVNDNTEAENFYLLLQSIIGVNLKEKNPYILFVSVDQREHYLKRGYTIISSENVIPCSQEYASCMQTFLQEYHFPYDHRAFVDDLLAHLINVIYKQVYFLLDLLWDYVLLPRDSLTKQLESKMKSTPCFRYFKDVLSKLNSHALN